MGIGPPREAAPTDGYGEFRNKDRIRQSVHVPIARLGAMSNSIVTMCESLGWVWLSSPTEVSLWGHSSTWASGPTLLHRPPLGHGGLKHDQVTS